MNKLLILLVAVCAVIGSLCADGIDPGVWSSYQTSEQWGWRHFCVLTNETYGWAFTVDANTSDTDYGNNYDLPKHTCNLTGIRGTPSQLVPLIFPDQIAPTGKTFVCTIGKLAFKFSENRIAADRVGSIGFPQQLRTIAANAFSTCSNATGRIVFPASLTTLGENAFYRCNNLILPGDGLIPSITTIPGGCFRDGVRIDGDLDLTHVVTVSGQAFRDCKTLKFVRFGPALKTIGGGWQVGSFMGCTALTNFVTDARASEAVVQSFAFNGCTSLVEADLTGISRVEVGDDDSNAPYTSQPPFMGCSSLKKMTFGTNLTYLAKTAFKGVGNLETVVFEGPPPLTFKPPFLYGVPASKPITTYVRKENVTTLNAVGTNWVMLAENNVVNRQTSTWAASYVSSDVGNLATRLLLALGGTGVTMIYR